MNATIVGAGWYVPEAVIPNSFFDDGKPWYFYDGNGERVPETDPEKAKKDPHKHTFLTDAKIREISGIGERRKTADDEYVPDMAAHAALKALQNAHMDAKDLDGIIVATVTTSRSFSAATAVGEMVGATNAREAYDIANACAGFPAALKRAYPEVVAGKTYLVVGAENLTRIVDYEGRDVNANLFGDGAGAAIVVRDPLKGVLAYGTRYDSQNGKLDDITRDPRGLLRMPNGPRVLKNAVRSMAAVTEELCREAGWAQLGADFYVFHQANNNITERLIRETGIDAAKVGNNIQNYGNMSAATNPILLAQSIEQGYIREGSRVIIASFGAGLVTAGVAVQF